MAVSVKDFLDAIRGRFNDEPNKVEVTGSMVIKDSDQIDLDLAPNEQWVYTVDLRDKKFTDWVFYGGVFDLDDYRCEISLQNRESLISNPSQSFIRYRFDKGDEKIKEEGIYNTLVISDLKVNKNAGDYLRLSIENRGNEEKALRNYAFIAY